MEKVYLIDQIQIDPEKNLACNAVAYKSIGWVSTQQEAMKICAKSKTYTKSDCWAIIEPLPEFKYRELKSINS